MSESLAARRVARALDALRRGWPLQIIGAKGAITLLPVETAAPGFWDGLVARAPMLISHARAATLKITNQRAAAEPDSPVLVRASQPVDAVFAMAMADPARDLAYPFKGPFKAHMLEHADAAAAALQLARIAGLLPGFMWLDQAADDCDRLWVRDLAEYHDAGQLVVAARAQLPVAASEMAEIIAFRSAADGREHVALIVGSRDERPPLVRIHSECLTGDILGSLKCDCGPQLHAALKAMAGGDDTPGWGVLLYLRQEGRGIGLINKLRAYEMQDQGFDTVDANNRLGFATDARDFAIAARMLELLAIPSVKLMTNNPDKVQTLVDLGVDVVERLAVITPTNPHNARYLATKRDRTGHQL